MKEVYDASERFITYYQQLKALAQEHKQVMGTEIGKRITEQVSEEYDDTIERILPDFEKICIENKFDRSEEAIREIVSKFQEEKVADCIKTYPRKLKKAVSIQSYVPFIKSCGIIREIWKLIDK